MLKLLKTINFQRSKKGIELLPFANNTMHFIPVLTSLGELLMTHS